jgi:hypothetical protein
LETWAAVGEGSSFSAVRSLSSSFLSHTRLAQMVSQKKIFLFIFLISRNYKIGLLFKKLPLKFFFQYMLCLVRNSVALLPKTSKSN